MRPPHPRRLPLLDETLLTRATGITGEVWSQLVASGSRFADMTDPQPMIRVGSDGQTGVVEISDILFTSVGSLPGLIMVEWNIAGSSQASAGMWDAHFRVGGADGTNLQVADCPTSKPIQPGCIAATMMLHVNGSSNGYFENMWAWVADHDLDDPQNTMVSVAVARGILVESNTASWYASQSPSSLCFLICFLQTSAGH